jgi:preprotein translocase subunit SecA
MLGFLTKLFGTPKSEKDIKAIMPLVEKIKEQYAGYASLDIDALRSKTAQFKNRIQTHVADITKQIAQLKADAESLPAENIAEKDNFYQQIDTIKKDKDKKLEEVLLEILPEAFAVIKETAKRFTENTTITVTASELDKTLAATKNYITIEGNHAIYKNTWPAGGNEITWNMIHYDVQLIGGIVLHQGKISEMATGEGKTLVSTLPIYLNALAGEGVHLVTVNDYLAKRDSEWNGPIFEFLGLTVDCIDKHEPNSEERRNAYLADITYGTNNEFGFDYLRDNMVHSPEEMVQRKHHFAIVDEVDSVLIDDARTPLIISGPIPRGDQQQFEALKPRVAQLVEAQRRITSQFLTEAKKKFAEGNEDVKDGGLSLMRSYRGLPKSSALIKFLSEPGIKAKLQKIENHFIADNNREMRKVDEELLFYIDEKNNNVELTDKGLQTITKGSEDPEFFVLPDISIKLNAIDTADTSADEKLHAKEAILNDYSLKSERIHTVQQLLKAYTLFEKDDEYVVIEGQVKIVDEQTGRIMEGRRYSDGLHQAIEAKENVKIEAATQTYATITLQNYFRMYHKLGGMTGTAETEAGEFWDIYKLDVVTIPTNIKPTRKDEQDLVFKTKREKYKAVIDEIEKMVNAGRPCLVGTTSVETSELLGRMLRQRNIDHNVLNAKQHAKEAQIVAEAGMAGKVTIATNMAGRGTDIKLTPEVKAAGGLAIIGTERHESRRVDRQLRGRAGRQGDPGSSQFFVSLEDELMRLFGSDRIAGMMDRFGHKEGDVIQHSMVTNSIERAQKKVEENNFGIRKRLLEYDDVMNKQRTVIYAKRNHALFGDRLALDVDNSFYSLADNIVNSLVAQNDYDGFVLETIVAFGMQTNITKAEFDKGDINSLTNTLYSEAIQAYRKKNAALAESTYPVFNDILKTQGKHIENVLVPFTDGKKGIQFPVPLHEAIETQGKSIPTVVEKTITLHFIDDAWKEHLRTMDDLRHSINSTAHLEQKDPLILYKKEAFVAFGKMNNEVNRDIISFLCHAAIPVEQSDPNQMREAAPQQRTDMSKMHVNKEDIDDAGDGYGANEQDMQQAARAIPIVRDEPKIGRNEPCPCGSGKKFKQCHGK